MEIIENDEAVQKLQNDIVGLSYIFSTLLENTNYFDDSVQLAMDIADALDRAQEILQTEQPQSNRAKASLARFVDGFGHAITADLNILSPLLVNDENLKNIPERLEKFFSAFDVVMRGSPQERLAQLTQEFDSSVAPQPTTSPTPASSQHGAAPDNFFPTRADTRLSVEYPDYSSR